MQRVVRVKLASKRMQHTVEPRRLSDFARQMTAVLPVCFCFCEPF
jgi:hypothetical protein